MITNAQGQPMQFGQRPQMDPIAKLQARKQQLLAELAKLDQLLAKFNSDPAALELAKQMMEARV